MRDPNTPLRPVIFGEVLYDRFPDGNQVLGGAPFNVAWHLKGFGENPLFISRLGKDAAGDRILEAMTQWDMDVAGVQQDGRHSTGTVQVSFDQGEPQYDILPDQAYDFIAEDALPAIDRASFLYHGSLALRQGVSRASLEALASCLDAPRFMDVNLRAPWWHGREVKDWCVQADWVKLNQDELAHLAPQGATLVDQARLFLRECTLERLVVTLGAAGALACSAQGEFAQVAPEAQLKVVDTVGAGDAFCAVFLLGQMRHWPLATTLARAQDFASAMVKVRGATVSAPDFYQPFLDAWSP